MKRINKKPLSLLIGSLLGTSVALTSFQAQAQEDEASLDDLGFLEEIIVTATRREESIDEVPIAITVNSGEELELKQVVNVESVSSISPSVAFGKSNNSSSSPTLVIRGIGTVGNSRAFEGSVGVFVDGVYRSRSGQILTTFMDFENLQVARGPQGTLFGKNTTAGALVLETKKAEIADEVSGKVSATVGSDDLYRVQGAINIPMGDSFAARLAVLTDDRDGQYTELFTGEDEGGSSNDAARLSTVFAPNDDLEIRLSADYSKREAQCCHGYGLVRAGSDSAVMAALTGLFTGGQASYPAAPSTLAAPDTFARQGYLNAIAHDETVDKGVTLSFDWQLGNGTLTGIFADRSWKSENLGFDADYLPLDIIRGDESFKSDQHSAELLYSVDVSDSVNVLAGLYYAKEELDVRRDIIWGVHGQGVFDLLIPQTPLDGGGVFNDIGITTAGSAPAGTVPNNELMGGENESVGIFLRTEFQLTDTLSAFAGVRYSEDEKSGFGRFASPSDPVEAATFWGSLLALGSPDTPPAAIPGLIGSIAASHVNLDTFTIIGLTPTPDYDAVFDDDAISASLGLQFAPADDVNIYASYNRGYKAGGVNYDNAAATTGQPVEITLTGLGLLPAEDPRYESEFVDTYELGAKITWLDGNAKTNIAFFYNDIEDLQINQFLGLNFKVINASGASSQGAELEHTQAFGKNVSMDAAITYLDTEIDNDASAGFLGGRDLVRAPELAANFGLNVFSEVGNDVEFNGRISYEWKGDHTTEAAILVEDFAEQEAFGLINMNAGFTFVNSGITVNAWCRNCADEDYVTLHFNAPFTGSGTESGIIAYTGDSRTMGVTISSEF